MKRSQIILISGAIICLLLCVAAAAFLIQSFAVAGRMRGERDRQQAELERIYKSDPFPNATNLYLVGGDFLKIKEWTAGIQSVLATNTVAVAGVSPSVFVQDIKDRIAALTALSPEPGVRIVPDHFAFGFSRYHGTDAQMPAQAHVPRLSLQFAMVEALARQVLTAGIDKLADFRRDAFDSAQAGETPGSAGDTPDDGAFSAIASSEKFTILFSTRQSGLGAVLNRLETCSPYAVVTSVTIRKNHQEDVIPPAPERLAQVKPPDAQLKPGELRFPPDEQRKVSGPDIDPLLDVQIELSVLTFTNPPD